MGDWYETIVDPVVGSDDAPALAERVVAALVSAGFLKPERSDCTVGGSGYPPAPGVFRYLRGTDTLLMDLRTNGLDVVSKRSVHLTVNLERLACPACGVQVDDLAGVSWRDAVSEWYEGREGPIACPACRREAAVATWIHEPPCGFGNLAFTFWNWPPFTPEYWKSTPAEFIEAVVGHACVRVSGKL